MKRKLGYALYVLIGKHLPASISPLGGKIASRIRYLCGKLFLKQCGSSVNIERNATFSIHTTIGDYSGIGINANLSGPIQIGKYVMMGPNCTIYSRNHAFDRTDIPMIFQGYDTDDAVVIEDDVWIGGDVTIMSGLTIHSGSIIGARSVVTHDVPQYAIVAGNPAKVIGYRNH